MSKENEQLMKFRIEDNKLKMEIKINDLIWLFKTSEANSDGDEGQIAKVKKDKKEEIEESKSCLNEIIQNTYAERKAIKLENLKHYIEQLEFQNATLKAEHNHNITRIKELEQSNKILDEECSRLEQKESILDKVTDTLKEEMKKAKEQIKYYEKQYSISKERDSEFYIKSFHRQNNRWQSRFETCREILEIIEGEKK